MHAQASPPNDALQKLLGPLQNQEPSEFQNGLDPSLPGLDETLQWEPDGLPTWWPQERLPEDGPAWSAQERRHVLLRNLREHLPNPFPVPLTKHSERQQLVDTLRHIYDALISRALAILTSS
jgi:hypothetical protein